MRTIYLLRHGLTAAGARGCYCGSSDMPLSEEGLSALLARKAQGIYPPPHGLRFFTSGMRRTDDTLTALYGPVPRTALPGLREMNFGSFELHTYEELKDFAVYQAWISHDNEKNCCPDGESGAEMTRRVLSAFAALPGEGDLLIVTHGGPIAAILANAFPTVHKNRFDWQPLYGCGYRLLMEGSVPLAYETLPSAKNSA